MKALLEISLQGTAMIIGVIILRAVFVNRMPKTVFVTLWELVILRLLLPFGTSVAQNNDIHITAPSVTPAYDGVIIAGQTTSHPAANVMPSPAQVGHRVDIIAVIWGIGAIACAVYLLWNYVRCRREFGSAIPLKSPFVTDWQSRQRTKRVITVKVTDAISSPMTYGLLRPVILLPKNIDIQNTSQLRYILMHEYVHIKKLDGLLKAVSSAAVCVHWFNPLVWAMHNLLCRDIELRCDESVLKELGIDFRADYARTIIQLEEQRSGFLPVGSGFARNPAKERIVAIMKYSDKTSVSAFILTIVLVIAVAVTAVACAARNDADDIDKEDVVNNVAPDDSVEVQTNEDENTGDGETVFYTVNGEFDLTAGDTVVIDMERDLSSPDYYAEDETIEFGYVLHGERVSLGAFDGSDPTKPLDENLGKADNVGMHFDAPEDGHYSFYISYRGSAKFTLVSATAERMGFEEYNTPVTSFPYIEGIVIGEELGQFSVFAGQTLQLHVWRDLSSPEYYADNEIIEFGYILNGAIVPIGGQFDGYNPTIPQDVNGGKADSFSYNFTAPEDGVYQFYLTYKGDAEFKFTEIYIFPFKRLKPENEHAVDDSVALPVAYSDGLYLINNGEPFYFKEGESAAVMFVRDLSSEEYYDENEITEFGFILNGQRAMLISEGVVYDPSYGVCNRIINFRAGVDGEYTFYLKYSGDAEFKIDNVSVVRYPSYEIN